MTGKYGFVNRTKDLGFVVYRVYDRGFQVLSVQVPSLRGSGFGFKV